MTIGRRVPLYAAALIGLLLWSASLLTLVRGLVGRWVAGAAGAGALGELARGSSLPWLVAGLVGLAVWAVSWGVANRAARPLTMAGAAERSSSARKAYLYLGQLAALAAVVAQAGAAVRALALPALAGSTDPWPVRLAPFVSLMAGALIALVVWGYLRWETIRDGDFGREAGRAANWRRAYLYSAALAGSALAIAGAGELLRAPLAALSAGAPEQAHLATALALLAVGAPLALCAWGRANRLAGDAPAAEMNALSRVTLRYGGLLFSTILTLVTFGYLLAQVLLLVLGRPLGPFWRPALAYLPAGAVIWLVCAGGIRWDAALGGESARTGAIRRLVRYAVAALALAGFWFGLTEFVRLILLAGLRVRPADPAAAAAWWGRFAYAAALVFIAAPAWWGHWWSQQARARAAGPGGRVERASAVRRVYLVAVILVGASVTLAAVGFAAFLFLSRQAAGAVGARAGLAAAAAAAGVALLWAIAHALTLRGDGRWLAEDREAESRPPVPPPGAAGAATPGPGTRSYSRAALARAAAAAGFDFAVGPGRELAVVDGADGAVGAALLAALARALPDAVLWPVGLNAGAQVAMLNVLAPGTPPAVPADAILQAAAVVGPSDILIPGGLDGDVTPELAAALAATPARLLLLPPRDPRLRWVAAPDWPPARWVENAVLEAAAIVRGPA